MSWKAAMPRETPEPGKIHVLIATKAGSRERTELTAQHSQMQTNAIRMLGIVGDNEFLDAMQKAMNGDAAALLEILYPPKLRPKS